MNIIDERRYGKFKYTTDALKLSPIAIQQVFANVIPIRIEHYYAEDRFYVEAFSSYFDPILEGQSPPEYTAVFVTEYLDGKKFNILSHFKRIS